MIRPKTKVVAGSLAASLAIGGATAAEHLRMSADGVAPSQTEAAENSETRNERPEAPANIGRASIEWASTSSGPFVSVPWNPYSSSEVITVRPIRIDWRFK